jgi:class 3 adenylate cyclase/pimeloyl-ACP methyl ester carboxylesterase
MIEPRVQYVTSADGTQIAYTTFGEGPLLVFPANAWGEIGMYTSTRSLASNMLPVIASQNRVVLYDGRGSGASDRNINDFSLAARLADLEAVVDAIGGGQFAMFGLIHGAQVAVAYAVKHPDRVSRMALVGAYANGSDYYSGTPMMRAIKALSEIAADEWELYTLTMANWIWRFNDPDQAREMAALYREQMTPRDYLSLIAGCEESDITPLLGDVKAPTLVVRDAESPFSTPETSRRVATGIPGAQSITVNGPLAMGAAVHSFILGLEPSEAGVTGAGSVMAVLFTDIVGHTEMMRRLGDSAGREVLREHERITRNVLKSHAGTEVKSMGDGFMASFGSVSRAVECAVALQRAFADRNSQASTTGSQLNVRVGLNAGEPIADEGDLFGSSVILASRIAGKAEGGEIFASLAVRELCAGKGFLFADLGDHELRGFEDPSRIFEVKWKE